MEWATSHNIAITLRRIRSLVTGGAYGSAEDSCDNLCRFVNARTLSEINALGEDHEK